MATEQKENAPQPPRKPEGETLTTDQRIDLDAVVDGDESSLAEPGDVDQPTERNPPKR